MTSADWISAASDIIVAVAAALGLVLAWRGLTTWRDQLRGTAEYELARGVLRDIYRLRSSIQRVRHSFMSAAEMPEPPADEAQGMSRDELHYYGMSKAYQARWNQVMEAHRDLDPKLLEAEVLWGENLKAAVTTLQALEHELFISIRHHLELHNPATPAGKREAIEQIVRRKRDVMYDSLEVDDVFAADFLKAIRDIEAFLRPHLRRP